MRYNTNVSTVQVPFSLSLSFTFQYTHDREIYLHATEAAGCPSALNAQSGDLSTFAFFFPSSLPPLPPIFSYLYKLLVMHINVDSIPGIAPPL